jgi:hypothetical protein
VARIAHSDRSSHPPRQRPPLSGTSGAAYAEFLISEKRMTVTVSSAPTGRL